MLWYIELEIEEVRVTVNLPHHGQLTGAVVYRAEIEEVRVTVNLPHCGQLTGAVVYRTGDRGGKSYSEPTSSRPTHWCCDA